jgi:hypothetical protein
MTQTQMQVVRCNRYGAGASGWVRLTACVQGQRVEMGIGVSGHGVLVPTVYQMQIVGYIESHASRAGVKGSR